ncbi:MAG: hypothetical protein OD811_02290 [Alphaproteobacteria bacterium]
MLGGSDKDVKKYFFNLPPDELAELLEAYGRVYGQEAKEYAEATFHKWRSGRVQMSGLVAGRLFELLPPRMPLSKKYELTENLWQHFGPSSHKVLRIGPDTRVEDVVSTVQGHIEDVVVNYKIPDDLERRFDWLSSGDVRVKQDLLNYHRQKEKTLAVYAVRKQLPVMLEHIRNGEGIHTHRLAQILEIGKHKLEVLVDKEVLDVKLLDPVQAASVSRSTSSDDNYSWIWWWVAAAVILFLLFGSG